MAKFGLPCKSLGLVLCLTQILSSVSLAQNPSTTRYISDLSDCYPTQQYLARTARGVVGYWLDGGNNIRSRSFDRNVAALNRGQATHFPGIQGLEDSSAVGLSATVEPSGKRIVTWVDVGTPAPFNAMAQLFSSSGQLEATQALGEQELLEDGNTRSRVQVLEDGSFMASFSSSREAYVFDFQGAFETIDLGTQGSHSDLLRIGDELWHAYSVDYVTSPPSAAVVVERRSLEGDLLDEVATSGNFGTVYSVRLAKSEQGTVTLAWSGGGDVQMQRFNQGGDTLIEPTVVSNPSTSLPRHVDLTSDAEGNSLVVWGESFDFFTVHDRVLSRTLSATGELSNGPVEIFSKFRDDDATRYPQATEVGAGKVLVSATLYRPIPVDPVPCGTEHRGIVTRTAELGGQHSLLLQKGRFKIEVDFQDQFNGGSGRGLVIPNTELAGSFYFFDRSNKEIEIKIIDGRAVNGFFWVFAAGLSNVGYQIEVVDQRTGMSRVYDNPPGDNSNFLDTAAFP